MCGDVDEESFEVMGPFSDPSIRKYGKEMGANCLCDLNEMRNMFDFEDGTDHDNVEFVGESQDVTFSKEIGLRAVLICIEWSLDRELDELWLQGLWLTDLGD